MCNISGSRLLKAGVPFSRPPTECKQYRNAGPEEWFWNFTWHHNHLESILKRELLDSTPGVSKAGGVGWGLRIFISNKVLGDADATAPVTTATGHWPELLAYRMVEPKERAVGELLADREHHPHSTTSKKSTPVGFEPMQASIFLP